jgi:hypothetical protein
VLDAALELQGRHRYLRCGGRRLHRAATTYRNDCIRCDDDRRQYDTFAVFIAHSKQHTVTLCALGWNVHAERADVCVASRPTFTDAELALVERFVWNHREQWQRHETSSLWSLGCAAYRFAGTRDEYRAAVRVQNAVFRTELGGVYRTLLSCLSQIVGTRVRLLHEVAHPGFHILRFDEHRSYDPGSAHYDAPHRRIPWLRADAVIERPGLSFVVPIVVPRAPTGLEVFPAWEREKIPGHLEPLSQSYRPGTTYVFSGLWNHRIAPIAGDPDEVRLTMQGHIMSVSGQAIAFW